MVHNASSLPLKLFSRLKESECPRIDFIWFFLQNWRHFFHEKVNYHNVYVAVNNWLLPNGENFSFSLGKCKHFFVLLILYHLLSILNFQIKFVFTEIGTITAKCKNVENFAINVMIYLPLINCYSWWFEIGVR